MLRIAGVVLLALVTMAPASCSHQDGATASETAVLRLSGASVEAGSDRTPDGPTVGSSRTLDGEVWYRLDELPVEVEGTVHGPYWLVAVRNQTNGERHLWIAPEDSLRLRQLPGAIGTPRGAVEAFDVLGWRWERWDQGEATVQLAPLSDSAVQGYVIGQIPERDGSVGVTAGHRTHHPQPWTGLQERQHER